MVERGTQLPVPIANLPALTVARLCHVVLCSSSLFSISVPNTVATDSDATFCLISAVAAEISMIVSVENHYKLNDRETSGHLDQILICDDKSKLEKTLRTLHARCALPDGIRHERYVVGQTKDECCILPTFAPFEPSSPQYATLFFTYLRTAHSSRGVLNIYAGQRDS